MAAKDTRASSCAHHAFCLQANYATTDHCQKAESRLRVLTDMVLISEMLSESFQSSGDHALRTTVTELGDKCRNSSRHLNYLGDAIGIDVFLVIGVVQCPSRKWEF